MRRLGAGGTGEVWVGKHVTTGGLAAVKLFRARRARAAHRLLFVREGAIIARLSHPHIVRLGDEHLVTQLVDGSDLGRSLRSGVDAASARRIAVQIGAALAYAHGRGVVRRDVEPGNILIDRNNNAFLGDFGAARGSSGASGARRHARLHGARAGILTCPSSTTPSGRRATRTSWCASSARSCCPRRKARCRARSRSSA